MLKINNLFLERVATFFLVLFPYLMVFSLYSGIEEKTILLYIVISVCVFLLQPARFINGIHSSFLFYLYVFFVFSLFFSTLFYTSFENSLSVLLQFVLFLSTCVLSFYSNSQSVFKFNYLIILFISFISIISYLFGIDTFNGIKEGTKYLSIDASIGGGISTIFEFRHYYAAFLTIAILYNIYFSQNNFIFNSISLIVLIINLLLTYTRNSWIACIICLIVFFLKKYDSKIVLNKNHLILFLIFIVFLICVFLIGFTSVLENTALRLNTMFGDGSSTDVLGARGYSIHYGIQYMFKNPQYLLIGGGNYFALHWLEANPYHYWKAAIDNQYVTVFMNQGIIGISVLITIIIKISSLFLKGSKEQQFISLSLISLFISMFFYEILGGTTSIFVLFLVLLCNLLFLKKDYGDERKKL